MVGNDVIDIEQTKKHSNWERVGFVEKVFNNEEQKIIIESLNPFNTVWRMWSMKESAYKIQLQHDGVRSFYPTKIGCKIISSENGLVCIGKTKINTHTITNDKYIFTYASINDLASIENSVFYLMNKSPLLQSKQTHQKILQYISSKNQLELNQLSIKKTSANIPQFFYKKQKLNLFISLTHHGHFGAFSINR